MIEPLRAFLETHREDIRRFPGYVAVSGTAFAVDFSAYALLLPFAKFAFAAAAGAYAFGVLTHYLLSSRILYRDRLSGRGVTQEAPMLAKYFATGLLGLLITTTAVALLADVLNYPPLIARVAAAGCSFGAVYLALRLFVIGGPVRAGAQAA